jgi:hypothetical protein
MPPKKSGLQREELENSGTASGQTVRSSNYSKFWVHYNYQKRIWVL